MAAVGLHLFLFFSFVGDPASQSTPIRWKEGNDLTKKGKDKNVGKGRKRAMEQKTFFNWFTDHGDPSADDIAEVMWQSYEISNLSALLDRVCSLRYIGYAVKPLFNFPICVVSPHVSFISSSPEKSPI